MVIQENSKTLETITFLFFLFFFLFSNVGFYILHITSDTLHQYSSIFLSKLLNRDRNISMPRLLYPTDTIFSLNVLKISESLNQKKKRKKRLIHFQGLDALVKYKTYLFLCCFCYYMFLWYSWWCSCSYFHLNRFYIYHTTLKESFLQEVSLEL